MSGASAMTKYPAWKKSKTSRGFRHTVLYQNRVRKLHSPGVREITLRDCSCFDNIIPHAKGSSVHKTDISVYQVAYHSAVDFYRFNRLGNAFLHLSKLSIGHVVCAELRFKENRSDLSAP